MREYAGNFLLPEIDHQLRIIIIIDTHLLAVTESDGYRFHLNDFPSRLALCFDGGLFSRMIGN